MQAQAFWVKDSVAVDITGSRHILFMVRHPCFFGLSREDIEREYDRFGEPIGIEGRARDELILRGTRQGWVRVRHYSGREDYWSVQFDTWARRGETVERFLRWAVDAGMMGHQDAVTLTAADETGARRQVTVTWADGGVEAWLRGCGQAHAPAVGRPPIGTGSFTLIGHEDRERLAQVFGVCRGT